MEVEKKIGFLLKRIESGSQVAPETYLYTEGVKAKLGQCLFCLGRLRNLELLESEETMQDGASGPGMATVLTVDEEVSFYCESFWVSLRAALDILGQLINQLRVLGLNERNVDFKQVANRLGNIAGGTLLAKAVGRCIRSRGFKNLEEYRHCSMHRRQVYIEKRVLTIQTSGTPGYFSDSATSSLERKINIRCLCGNPWELTPVVDSGTTVLASCENFMERIEDHIGTIIYHLP